MRLEQIDYVIEIVETGSFSQAARNLYLSQPNLSYSIKQLEEEMGFEIFDRKNSGATLTERGREFLMHCQIIRQECISLRKMQEPESFPSRLILRVGTLNTNRSPDVTLPIINRYQGSPVDFVMMNYTDLSTLLHQITTCQLDLGFLGIASPHVHSVRIQLKNKGIEYHPIKEVPICATFGPHSPLYGRTNPIPLEDLCPHTLVSFGNLTEDSSFCLPFILGLETKARGSIHINDSMLFYRLLRDTPVIGLIAAEPDKAAHADDVLQTLPLADCPVSVELAWIKLRRTSLNTIGMEILESYLKSC